MAFSTKLTTISIGGVNIAAVGSVEFTNERGILTALMPLGQWERTSVPLNVPDEYRQLFARFLVHFKAEAQALGDATLTKEADVLTTLSQSQAVAAGP